MDIVERFNIALRREGESDRVGSFLQSIMPIFAQKWDERLGEEIDDTNYVQTDLKDFTIYKHLGFDSSWCGTPGGNRVFSEASDKLYEKMNKELSFEEKRAGYQISRGGAKIHNGWLNGLPYTYTHEGVLKTPKLFEEWYGGSYITDPPADAVQKVNNTLKQGLEKGILPIFTSHLISEPLISTISIGAAALWARKDPSYLRKAFDIIMETALQRIQILCESEAPIILIADDCAYKNRPIYSPEFYKEFFIPHWKKVTQMIHNKGKLVIFHSDGYVEPYYPLLIDAKVDAHQSLEPIAGMDLKHLKETYGSKISLIGNIDVSRLIPYGTKEEVIDAVKQCLRDGARGGGFIFSTCSDLTNSCKLENAITMMETYKKYRNYPINI